MTIDQNDNLSYCQIYTIDFNTSCTTYIKLYPASYKYSIFIYEVLNGYNRHDITEILLKVALSTIIISDRDHD